MQNIPEKTAESTPVEWRHCPVDGALARSSYYRERCPICGGRTNLATPEQIAARGSILEAVVAVHGRRPVGAR